MYRIGVIKTNYLTQKLSYKNNLTQLSYRITKRIDIFVLS